MTGVSLKTVVVEPPTTSVRSTGALLTTVHSEGASTWRVKVALRSGWSKHAKTRWASKGSHCV